MTKIGVQLPVRCGVGGHIVGCTEITAGEGHLNELVNLSLRMRETAVLYSGAMGPWAAPQWGTEGISRPLQSARCRG